MSRKPQDQDYDRQEAQQRFEAALRGARLVGHKTQSEMKIGRGRSKQNPGGIAKQTKAKKRT